MNDQTRLIIGLLEANPKLMQEACERALRYWIDWLGIVLMFSPEKRIEFFLKDEEKLSKIAEELAEELADEPGLDENRYSVVLAIYRDTISKVDWVEVAKYVIPHSVKFYEEEAANAY